MSEEWGPWIEHDGGPCPVPDGTICHRVFNEPANGTDKTACGKLEHISPVEAVWERRAWEWVPGAVWIIRYRIRKPRALIELREMIANLPTTAPQEATQ